LVEPITQAAAITAGKEIVEKVIEESIKRSKMVDKGISNNFKIRGRDMLIKCPESIQQYSISFEPKGGSIFHRKEKFEFGKVRRVTVRPILSLQSIPHAITILKNGFELDLKSLKSGEAHIMDIEYKIEDSRFIDSLVNRNVASETPKDDCTEYWMVAQLKHLKSLQQDFGYLELRDVDFGIDVAVHQDIKMKIPTIFRQRLETIVQLTRPKGRSERFREYMRLVHQDKQKYSGKEFDILGNIQDLFFPPTFQKFVEVTKDFHYHTSERGSDFYETLPFPTWPKTMKVISRTDLDFEKPASDGLLIYKKRDFIKELEEIFE